MAFRLEIDILNRALVHLGKERIRSLNEQSINAIESHSAYDNLRLAELRRNTWGFATRRVILRSVDDDTFLYTPAAHAAGTTYAYGAIVSYGNEWWQSQAAANLGNTPESGPYWQHYFGVDVARTYDDEISYHTGEIVIGSDAAIYLSKTNNNTDDPVTDPTNWLTLAGTTAAFAILYPIGTGSASDASTQNVIRLPRGYLRKAPSNPTAGVFPHLGGPVNAVPDAWVIEGNYIVAPDTGPVLLRYVADFTDVSQMDPMFCEALAARIATEIAPRIVTENLNTLLQNARAHYRQEMFEARVVNGIETGAVEPPEDSYITVRW